VQYKNLSTSAVRDIRELFMKKLIILLKDVMKITGGNVTLIFFTVRFSLEFS